MISERVFSNSFSSFWNEILPTADSFVRHMNLSKKTYIKEVSSRLDYDRGKRAVINEIAFRIFMNRAKGNVIAEEEMKQLNIEVAQYIKRIARNELKDEILTKDEFDEANELSESLEMFFISSKKKELQFWPKFRGCGKIHECYGDIVLNDKLIEVKSGDRYFRVTDVRQIIVYLCLDSVPNQYSIKNIVLLNPRKGIYFEAGVDDFIFECSRRKPIDVYGDIIEYLSTEMTSK